jgi:hypothetical protein
MSTRAAVGVAGCGQLSMNQTARSILNRLRDSGFAGLDGAEAAIVLPIADRLLTEIIRDAFPAVNQLREFELQATAGNIVAIWIRPNKPAFLPGFRIRALIESQPQLPSSPVLHVRILSRGVAALAGPAATFFKALPPGVSLEGDRLSLNLAILVEHYGAAEAIRYFTIAQLTTGDGRVIITLRAALPASDQTPTSANG